jgi:hypothetical protein
VAAASCRPASQFQSPQKNKIRKNHESIDSIIERSNHKIDQAHETFALLDDLFILHCLSFRVFCVFRGEKAIVKKFTPQHLC